MEEIKITKRVYKVFEITREIQTVLEGKFQGVWVEGEISNYTLHSSGHMYFSIRDEKSVLQCAMFKRANEKLKFKPEDGLKVICFGSIGVYPPRGNYQLIVEEIEPKGIGALQLQFEQLKAKLEKEELFDRKHKKEIPFLPTRIGVVTSPTGAAIQDILNVSRRRFSNVEIILNPVKVQGEGAKEEIADAIDLFNKLRNVDVMIVGRGGGSLEDLWAFNEEVVARAIFRSKIPVISAVGHEIDWTIADFVSDFRAPTPSAAAELVIPKKEDLELRIDNALRSLRSSLAGLIIQNGQRIDELTSSLSFKYDAILKLKEKTFHRVLGKLEALSPLAVLSRGYSITTKESGGVIKDSGEVSPKDIIRTRLSKGEIISKVEEIKRG